MLFRQAMVTWHGAVLAIWFWCLLSGAVASDLDVPMVVRPGSPISLEGLEGALITRLRLRADTPDGYLKVRDRESAEIVRTIPLVQIQGKGITSISLAPAETYDIFLASGPAETKVDVFGPVFYHEPNEQLAFALGLYPVRTSQDNLPVETDYTVFLLIQGGRTGAAELS